VKDLFMKKKMTEYIENFAFFQDTFIRLTDIEDYESIMEHYLNFETEICTCDSCREDEECIHIGTPDDDAVPDWD
jgi:hypothetical protein